MEYLLLYAGSEDAPPYDPAQDNIAEWVADVVAREVSEVGERLRPAEDATTVRVREGRVLVTEGPFTETKEWVGGFDIIDCPDLDEAIKIASKHPVARFGMVEVRPFMVWPDAEPGYRVVPAGFHDRQVNGRRYLVLVCVDPEVDPPAEDDDPQAWSARWTAAGCGCSATCCGRRRTRRRCDSAKARCWSAPGRSPTRRSGSPASI